MCRILEYGDTKKTSSSENAFGLTIRVPGTKSSQFNFGENVTKGRTAAEVQLELPLAYQKGIYGKMYNKKVWFVRHECNWSNVLIGDLETWICPKLLRVYTNITLERVSAKCRRRNWLKPAVTDRGPGLYTRALLAWLAGGSSGVAVPRCLE